MWGGDSKYVVSRDPLFIDHVILRMRSANFTRKITYVNYFFHLLFIQSTYIGTKFGE